MWSQMITLYFSLFLGPPLKSGCLSSLTQARYVLRYLFLQLKKKLSIRPKPNSPSELNPYHL